MEYIYFSRPDSDIEGLNVHTVRKASGKRLAQKDKGNTIADIVVGVPDSSVAACIAIATGVATATSRSELSAWKFEMIWDIRLESALQLSYSTWNVTPFSAPMSASCDWMFSTIWFKDASST